ncbi:MAG: hypothetical protein J1F32_00740 [Erysipelotrichales bacterium]|nr:hypothetical protein [Erysipelotrichales bacterium]
MKNFNYLIQRQDAYGAVNCVGYNTYNDSNKRKIKRFSDAINLDFDPKNEIVYEYINKKGCPLNKSDENSFFDGERDDTAFAFFSTLTESKGRNNRAPLIVAFSTEAKEIDFNPGLLINNVTLLERFHLYVNKSKEEDLEKNQEVLENELKVIQYEDYSDRTITIGDNTISQRFCASQYLVRYKPLILCTIDALIRGQFKTPVYVVAEKSVLPALFKTILLLLPMSVARNVSFSTNVIPSENFTPFLLNGVADDRDICIKDGIVVNSKNASANYQSYYVNALRSHPNPFEFAAEKNHNGDVLDLTEYNMTNESEFLDILGARYNLEREQNLKSIFNYFTTTYNEDECSTNPLLVYIIQQVTSSIENKMFSDLGFDMKQLAEYVLYAYNHYSNVELMDSIIKYILNKLNKPNSRKEVEYVSELFGLLIPDKRYYPILEDSQRLCKFNDYLEKIVSNNATNSYKITKILSVFITFALDKLHFSPTLEEQKFINKLFSIISEQYSHDSIYECLMSIISSDDVDRNYDIIELLIRNGFDFQFDDEFVNKEYRITKRLLDIVSDKKNTERNKTICSNLFKANIPIDKIGWLSEYLIDTFTDYDTLVNKNDEYINENNQILLHAVHQQTTQFIYNNRQCLNYETVSYFHKLYEEYNARDDSANGIAHEEEIRAQIENIYNELSELNSSFSILSSKGEFYNEVEQFLKLTKNLQNTTFIPIVEQKVPVFTLVFTILISILLQIPIFIFGKVIFVFSLIFVFLSSLCNIVSLQKYKTFGLSKIKRSMFITNLFIVYIPLLIEIIILVSLYLFI